MKFVQIQIDPLMNCLCFIWFRIDMGVVSFLGWSPTSFYFTFGTLSSEVQLCRLELANKFIVESDLAWVFIFGKSCTLKERVKTQGANVTATNY